MILNTKLNRTLLLFSLALLIFLILPYSLANDEISLNESQSSSIDNDIMLDSSQPTVLNEGANEVYVDGEFGSDEGIGTSSNPVKTISKSLDLVNDGGTIYLKGTFKGDGNSAIALEGTPNNIRFIGMEKATIDGENATSFAVINSGTYSFEKISFINNYKTGNSEELGGAITNLQGTLTFKDCIFENNKVYGINRGNGGAIDNEGTLKVINCIFKNNSAYVTNSSGFRKNAADGGAISNIGTLTVSNSQFYDNKALRNGGAIRTQDHSTNIITNCTFKNNLASGHLSGGSYGGALYTWDCSLDLSNSIFENNRAYDVSGYGALGGALSINRASGSINVKYCAFINNTAGGVSTVDGQSIYIDGVSANVNYCTIDTSIYSTSQSADFNYNWWISDDNNYKTLIESLPQSSAIKTYANLQISTDSENIIIGDEINVFIDLYWNGTKINDNINTLPMKTLTLESIGGKLNNKGGKFNGSFKAKMIVESEEISIILRVDNSIIKTELSKDDSDIKISYDEQEGIVKVHITDIESGYCILEIDNIKFYEEIINNTCNLSIPKITDIVYANISFYSDNSVKLNEKMIKLTPNKTETMTNTVVEVISPLSFQTSDLKAGEIGGYLKVLLKDSKGNAITNKTVEIAIDGKIYKKTTDSKGIASMPINFASSSNYAYAILFNGDDKYNVSPLTAGKITVTKKSTSIKANSKTFKAKAKTKYISVTLKSSKNKNDGKTYLSAGKKLTLKIKGKTYTAKTNKKGVAKFKIKLSKKGKYTSIIKFSGDNTYKASTKKIKIRLK